MGATDANSVQPLENVADCTHECTRIEVNHFEGDGPNCYEIQLFWHGETMHVYHVKTLNLNNNRPFSLTEGLILTSSGEQTMVIKVDEDPENGGHAKIYA